MGLNYSFVVVVTRKNVDGLLHAIARRLAGPDRARLTAAIPWRPRSESRRVLTLGDVVLDARGVAALSLSKDHEVGSDACFSFAYLADDAIVQYLSDPNNSNERALRGAQAQIGCVWTSLWAGENLAVVHATAATSSMSRLFRDSSSIRSSWADIFRESRAEALFLDTEHETWDLLAPRAQRVQKPDAEEFCFADDYHVSVDHYYRAAMTLAGL